MLVNCSHELPVKPPIEEGPVHKIVFAAKDARGLYKLYTVNDNGSEIKEIFSHEAEIGDLWVSPQGDRVNCSANTANPPYVIEQLVIVNTDGSGAVQITGYQNSALEEPQWFPDGEQILFGRFESYGAQFYRINVDGSNLIRITTDDQTSHRHPRLSPDGQKIAFEKRTPPKNTIWVMNIDGTNEKLLSDPASTTEDWQPEWTFDASRIIYANLNGLWSINPDGSGRRQITKGYGPFHCSPVADKLVFGLSTINVDGSGLQRLTNAHVRMGGYPILWSRDGTKIAFRGDVNGDGKEGICVITAEGAGLREITGADLEIEGEPIRAFDWVP